MTWSFASRKMTDVEADNIWRDYSDAIDADNIYIGMARDHDTLEEIGVVIALKVRIDGRQDFQVHAVMPPDQAVEVADAIHAAVRDI